MSSVMEERSIYVTGGAEEWCFSGCSYYFMSSLKSLHVQQRVFGIQMGAYRSMRMNAALWAVRMFIDPRPYFYLTREYHQINWRRTRADLASNDVYISFSPVIPETVCRSKCKIALMVDMTLDQYLRYEHFGRVPKRVVDEIKRSERFSYKRADRIFVPSESTCEQLKTLYGISPSKIEIIGRGINLPRISHSTLKRPRPDDGLLHVGFVGHDFKRKGLLTLIDAIGSSEYLRSKVVVHAVGPTERDLQPKSWLRLYGYVDKRRALAHYVEILRNSDIGYLFSESEGIPGSVLEFLAFGVPCLISDIPEMKSIHHLPGMVTLPLAAGVPGIRQQLLTLIDAPEVLAELKKGAAQNEFQGWDVQAERVFQWCRQ